MKEKIKIFGFGFFALLATVVGISVFVFVWHWIWNKEVSFLLALLLGWIPALICGLVAFGVAFIPAFAIIEGEEGNEMPEKETKKLTFPEKFFSIFFGIVFVVIAIIEYCIDNT